MNKAETQWGSGLWRICFGNDRRVNFENWGLTEGFGEVGTFKLRSGRIVLRVSRPEWGFPDGTVDKPFNQNPRPTPVVSKCSFDLFDGIPKTIRLSNCHFSGDWHFECGELDDNLRCRK